MRKLLKSIWIDQRGATATEYAILASLIAVVIIGVVALIGIRLSDMYGGLNLE